jgi:dinuclear metal center YbgI/SA1388 family protein
MPTIGDIINFLEGKAPLSLQESYDNAGLVCGLKSAVCTGVITSLDLTSEILEEAIEKKFNLIIVHHPPIFKPLKRIDETNPTTGLLLKAIQHNIAVYAIHTNLDNVLWGVNGEIARRIGLQNLRVLSSLQQTHQKLIVFVPSDHKEQLSNALFVAGAGAIGNYNECSYSAEGVGTFKPLPGANPFIGNHGSRERVNESKIEVIFPTHLQQEILASMQANHPYETVAYDLLALENIFHELGAGAVGELSKPMETVDFLELLKNTFQTGVIRHSNYRGGKIKRVAICGGSGKQLINNALSCKADAYVTADLSYHDFFIPAGKMLLADIGHFESEQFTSDLLATMLNEKFPTFAVLKSAHKTNPVNYFL